MKLKILLPTQVLLEAAVNQVNGEARNGAFGMLPHHVDFVTALVPGIFSFQRQSDGQTVYLATDEGILVKCGEEVLVSVRSAVVGDDLETLQQTVAAEFLQLEEQEKQSRSAIARLEAGFVRGFVEGYT